VHSAGFSTGSAAAVLEQVGKNCRPEAMQLSEPGDTMRQVLGIAPEEGAPKINSDLAEQETLIAHCLISI
jgi:hypothetical protein